MNIADVLKLTVNGYSADDIRELKKLSADSPEILDYAKSGKSLADVKSIIELTGELSKDDNPDQGPGDAGESDQSTPENGNDNLIKENEALKEQIRQMRTQNQFTDQSGKTPEDPLANLAAVMADCM